VSLGSETSSDRLTYGLKPIGDVYVIVAGLVPGGVVVPLFDMPDEPYAAASIGADYVLGCAVVSNCGAGSVETSRKRRF
jgi:hypothetical protein